MGFDYNRPAALFMKSPTGRGPPLGYRRFWSAAEAIRFAVETLPVTGMQVWLEVDNERLNQERIRQLYDTTILHPAEVGDHIAAPKESPAS
jgi:hypothetical protein